MKYTAEVQAYDAFVFELDDVIYPEKDYLLQVFYLFAQFMEYTEQLEAGPLLRFMEDTYRREGAADLFAKTAAAFGLAEKYQVNYDLLLQNARLPLKLLLFAGALEFFREIRAAGKPLFLLVPGDPAAQLNKIRQLEWNGLEQHLIVYFSAESESGTLSEALHHLLLKHGLDREKVLVTGKTAASYTDGKTAEIKFFSADKIS